MIYISKKTNIQDESTYFQTNKNKLPIIDLASEIFTENTEPLLHTNARFWIVKKGSALVNIQGEDIKIKKGSMVGILPWYYTQIKEVTEDLCMDVVVYDLDFVNILFKRTNDLFMEDYSLSNLVSDNVYVNLLPEEEKEVKAILDKLKNEITKYKKSDKFSNHMIFVKFMEIVVIFEKNIDSSSKKKLKNKHDIQIFHYIYSHLNENISLKNISENFYLSQSQISKYIKETTGLSFSSLASMMKLVKLMGYLNFSQMNLEELSVILGFKDPPHLSKFFKAKLGINTSEFKNKTNSHARKVIDLGKMEEITSYVFKYYYMDLKLEDLSIKFRLNQTEINNSFDFYLDKSFDSYLTYVRIINAAKILLIKDDTVTDIAYTVGFNTTKTFNRNFKKIYGINPSDFRKKLIYQTEIL
ncbi:Melibiose operon regulatory protein [Anaerococcus prevotii]|uniref:Transcriptional regulator, AraC family n=1 Tax=Anaerococcus prevotii (strain ATCC 9321 / DSM 20548 / JCM 6508 / NCTC 11806 / PC1) TaxID=525919 RepID=C7RF21_ANAPD|nr:helix-turn-helix domain-containing protein [Anaerococcus prevotii]ACV28082.1 transcriptional regulator, AraC family [Anaerococcus prevotii DSM 20548]SUU93631.1 Melibiose operon regulatory protein [Anaerococcus prevotii]